MNETIDQITYIIENGYISAEQEKFDTYTINTLLSSFVASLAMLAGCLLVFLFLKTKYSKI